MVLLDNRIPWYFFTVWIEQWNVQLAYNIIVIHISCSSTERKYFQLTIDHNCNISVGVSVFLFVCKLIVIVFYFSIF